MRRLPGGEAFVDLMKDRARKQQILEYDPFLRPRFKERALGRLPGSGEDKMSERIDRSQAAIEIRGSLQLRMQAPHVRLYRRRLQLSPGVRLQVELDIFMWDVERIEAEARQDARSPLHFRRQPPVT